MFEIILSSVASLCLLSMAIAATLRKRNFQNVALCVFLSLLALLEIKDQLWINHVFPGLTIRRIGLFLEALLPAALLLFSFSYARANIGESLTLFRKSAMVVALLFTPGPFIFPLNEFFYSPDLYAERMLFLGNIGYLFYLGIMGYCIIALVNLEAVFASTSGMNRWKMKYELLGMFSILAALIFYFSQGLLYRTINLNLIPIRSGLIIVASALIGYSKLVRGGGTRIFVSRYLVYRSFALLLIGVYLLALGLAGEGMRYFNEDFEGNVTIFAAFVMGILMLSLLLSERLRRRAKVYINKHFYPHKYDYRQEWLKFTGRLATCKTLADVQDTILSTYRETFGLKGASLYLMDGKRKTYRLSASQEMKDNVKNLQLSPGLVSYFSRRNRIFNPADGDYSPDREELAFLNRTEARLIIPLVADGDLEGLVVLGEQLILEKYIYEDYDLMKTIARQATLSLVNLRLSEELADTREIAAVAKISSFVVHDLKNLAYTLSLMVENADRHIGDPDFQRDMLDTIKDTVASVRGLIQNLKSVSDKSMLHAEPADLHFLVEDTVDYMKRVRKDLSVHYRGSTAVSRIDKEEMRKVAMNLLLNASDAIAGKGEITVETGAENECCYVRIQDNGCGMTEEFINNSLFRPFRTTKKNGLGIGLYQCKQIVEAHEGRIEVQSEPGEGSVFTVFLPLAVETVQEVGARKYL